MAIPVVTAENCDRIIKKYSNMIFKLAFAQTHTKENAEDVLQDTFLKLIQSKKEFESEEHLKAWIIRVAINTSKKIYSTSWYKKEVPLERGMDVAQEQEEKSEVYYAILELPEKYRTFVHLYYYEDMSVKEIAQVFNMKTATVETRIHRARKLLKKRLKGVYDYG